MGFLGAILTRMIHAGRKDDASRGGLKSNRAPGFIGPILDSSVMKGLVPLFGPRETLPHHPPLRAIELARGD